MSTVEQAPRMSTIVHHPSTSMIAPKKHAAWVITTFALVSGLMMWAAFFPLNLGWLAWFALVPLLLLVKARQSGRVIYVAALLGGLALFIPVLKWMRVAHPMMVPAWIALALYCAHYVPLAIFLLRRADRFRLPLALTLPVVWVTLEYLRAHLLTGFAWFFLGHTQHDFLRLIQITDLGGVYAVSFLVAAVNGLIADLLFLVISVRGTRLLMPAVRPRAVLTSAFLVVSLLAASVGYGGWRIGQSDFAQGPRVTMLQSNIPQDLKNLRTSDGTSAGQTIVQHTRDLTDSIVNARTETDLIIWPETTFTQDWMVVADGTPANDLPPESAKWITQRHQLVGSVALYSRTNVLLGLNTVRFGRGLTEEKFNSALLVHRNGTVQERYDKIHRVAFGEYLPMKESLPFMTIFSPYENDYSLTSGERMTRFALPTPRGEYRFGALICYEDSDPVLARRYVQDSVDGPPVHFLVNISNDGWFDGTEEHELHMAICRFRAIEARRAIVRSVNMGISGVIDSNGRVIALPGSSWAASKKIATTLTADVPIDSRASVYASAGDVFAVMCSVTCVGLLLLGGWKRGPLAGGSDRF